MARRAPNLLQPNAAWGQHERGRPDYVSHRWIPSAPALACSWTAQETSVNFLLIWRRRPPPLPRERAWWKTKPCHSPVTRGTRVAEPYYPPHERGQGRPNRCTLRKSPPPVHAQLAPHIQPAVSGEHHYLVGWDRGSRGPASGVRRPSTALVTFVETLSRLVARGDGQKSKFRLLCRIAGSTDPAAARAGTT